MFRAKAARLFKTYEMELITIIIAPNGSMMIYDNEKERQKAIKEIKKDNPDEDLDLVLC